MTTPIYKAVAAEGDTIKFLKQIGSSGMWEKCNGVVLRVMRNHILVGCGDQQVRTDKARIIEVVERKAK
jgi:hypothetical protein